MNLDPVLADAIRKGFSPPERLGVQGFAEKYVSLPASYALPGKVDLQRSRYLLEVFLALQDPRVRVVVVQAAVQTAKSLIADLYVPWVITNDCGNILWLSADEDLIKRYAQTRLNPILSNTAPVKEVLPSERFSRTNKGIVFPNFTSLFLGGANESNLQSLSVRYLIGDECWLWKAGYLEQFLARCNAFPNTSKVLLLSQAGDESHDFTELWRRGHQAEWGWTCPHCQKLQGLTFNVQRPDATYAGIRWDKNEITKPDRYNLVEVGKTVRLECYHCNGTVTDTPTNRRLLNDTGAYIVGNPNADPTIRSFTWNALANQSEPFSRVVSKYITAKEADEHTGYREPLRHFTQKVLARPWNNNLQLILSKPVLSDYDPNAEWPEERYRFMTVDVQANHYYALVRAWAQNGESRLLTWAKCVTWEQLRELQLKWQVKDQNVYVDSQFNTSDVYAHCCEYGHWGTVGGRKQWLCWRAFKGFDAVDFTHVTKAGNEKRIFSPAQLGNPGLGKFATGQRCLVFYWSNPSVKDVLKHHLDGKGAKFLVPKDDPDYVEQINSERKTRITDRRTGKVTWRWVAMNGRDNHLWDCECMQVVCASMAGVLGGVGVVEDTPDDATTEATTEPTEVSA